MTLPGKVISTAWDERLGNTLRVEFGLDLEDRFISSRIIQNQYHLKDKALVTDGQYVYPSTKVAEVGGTGTASTGVHLHEEHVLLYDGSNNVYTPIPQLTNMILEELGISPLTMYATDKDKWADGMNFYWPPFGKLYLDKNF